MGIMVAGGWRVDGGGRLQRAAGTGCRFLGGSNGSMLLKAAFVNRNDDAHG